ncbi:aquaporin-like protein [Talaromyces proteolyticus]|uniref:Aquaporin-like protein n=1 Tax=Talaromyces proteolyticus TaxID=1131652 RepID=A0AAD4PTG1_9EURO|nr:aquaporin-like protein [Talaromyces proteolyticus]KAH8693240.1 aquaporin-like protein [Talaromyces proteolyticus]
MPTAMDVENQKSTTRRIRAANAITAIRRHTNSSTSVQTPFAGRIGANQEFTVDKDDSEYAELLKNVPDAASSLSWSDSFSLIQFLQLNLWKSAVIEAMGTCLLVYISCFMAIGLSGVVKDFSSGPFVPSLVAGFANWILLSLFIFSTGPLSGGHLNPMITMATFFARLSTFPRSVLYIGFQLLGASVAGFLLRASLNSRSFFVPGCNFDPNVIPIGSAFTIECTVDFLAVFLAFGIGLDPRQKAVYGPSLGPILVGLILGISSFATGFTVTGYSGYSGNPARCFGAMVGTHFYSYHWVHWIAPLTASIIHGIIYWAVPPRPYHSVVTRTAT